MVFTNSRTRPWHTAVSLVRWIGCVLGTAYDSPRQVHGKTSSLGGAAVEVVRIKVADVAAAQRVNEHVISLWKRAATIVSAFAMYLQVRSTLSLTEPLLACTSQDSTQLNHTYHLTSRESVGGADWTCTVCRCYSDEDKVL